MRGFMPLMKLKKKRIDAILAPQITSPIREPKDFKNGIDLFINSRADFFTLS